MLFNGITLTSAGTLNQGMFSLQGGVGPNVNFQVAYGMSDDAQLEFIGQQLGNSNLPTGKAFKLGVGTKLRLLDQVQGDPFSLSVRGAFEQASSEADGEGLVSAELAFLYQINSQIALMFNPKAGFFGSTSLVGMGLGLNYNVLEGLQFIGEVTPMVTGKNGLGRCDSLSSS